MTRQSMFCKFSVKNERLRLRLDLSLQVIPCSSAMVASACEMCMIFPSQMKTVLANDAVDPDR
jgi:hypothetical protein